MNWFRRSGVMDESYVRRAKKQPILLPPRIEQLVPPKPRKQRVKISYPDADSYTATSSASTTNNALGHGDDILVSPLARMSSSTTAPVDGGLSPLSVQSGGRGGGGQGDPLSEAGVARSPLAPRLPSGTVVTVQQDPITLRYFQESSAHDPDVEAVVHALNSSNLGVAGAFNPARRFEEQSIPSPGGDSARAAGPVYAITSPGLLGMAAPVIPQVPWRPATHGGVINLLDKSDEERERIRAEQRDSYKRQMKLDNPPVSVRFPEMELDEMHARQLREEQQRSFPSAENASDGTADSCTATGAMRRGGSESATATNNCSVSFHANNSSDGADRTRKGKGTTQKSRRGREPSGSPARSRYTSPTGRTVKPLPASLKRQATAGLSGRQAPAVSQENTMLCLPRLCTMGITLLDFVEGVIELRVLQLQKQLADPPVGAVVDPYVTVATADGDGKEDAGGAEEPKEVVHYYHPRPFTYAELTESPHLLSAQRRLDMRAAMLGHRSYSPEIYGRPVPYTASTARPCQPHHPEAAPDGEGGGGGGAHPAPSQQQQQQQQPATGLANSSRNGHSGAAAGESASCQSHSTASTGGGGGEGCRQGGNGPLDAPAPSEGVPHRCRSEGKGVAPSPTDAQSCTDGSFKTNENSLNTATPALSASLPSRSLTPAHPAFAASASPPATAVAEMQRHRCGTTPVVSPDPKTLSAMSRANFIASTPHVRVLPNAASTSSAKGPSIRPAPQPLTPLASVAGRDSHTEISVAHSSPVSPVSQV